LPSSPTAPHAAAPGRRRTTTPTARSHVTVPTLVIHGEGAGRRRPARRPVGALYSSRATTRHDEHPHPDREQAMISTERLTEVFVELADTLVADFDLVEFLQDLVDHAADVSGADAVGI